MSSWWDDRVPAGDDLAPFDGSDHELEMVGAAIRSALVAPPDPVTAEAHLRLMVAARRATPAGTARPRPGPAAGDPRRPRRRATPGTARRPLGRVTPGTARPLWRLTAGLAGAAAVLAAAGVVGVLPDPVQQRLASAAASVGISLPSGHHDDTGRVVTPLPQIGPWVPSVTTTATPSPATAAPSGPVPGPGDAAPQTTAPPSSPSSVPPVPRSSPATTPGPGVASTGHRTPSPTEPSLPPTSLPAGGVAPTTTPPAGGTCVDAALVSIDATLTAAGHAVVVVVHTSGTVPYLSAAAGAAATSLTPTADGFAGTITSGTAIAVGSVVRVGSCDGSLQGSALIHA